MVTFAFLAGSDPLAHLLYWGVNLMAMYPKVQEKCQLELEDVIGRDRLPSLMDKSKTPYTEAVIHEIQRYSCLFALSPFRCNHGMKVIQ